MFELLSGINEFGGKFGLRNKRVKTIAGRLSMVLDTKVPKTWNQYATSAYIGFCGYECTTHNYDHHHAQGAEIATLCKSHHRTLQSPYHLP